MADISQRLARYHAGELPDVEPAAVESATESVSLVKDEDLGAATRTLLLAPAASSHSSVGKNTGSQYRTGTLVAVAGGGVLAALVLILAGAGAAWWWLSQRIPPSVFEELPAETVAPAEAVAVPVEEMASVEPVPPVGQEAGAMRVPWFIVSQPPGQELYVNGARAGMTPKRLMLEVGEHEFAIRGRAGKTVSSTVEVREDAGRNSTTLILPP